MQNAFFMFSEDNCLTLIEVSVRYDYIISVFFFSVAPFLI